MEEMRKCGRCGELKPIDEFAWHRKAKRQRQHYCRLCQSEYGKKHYAENRQRYIDLEANRKRARAEQRMGYLPGVLQDASMRRLCRVRPTGARVRSPGRQVICNRISLPDYNRERILAEMEKCEIVCANCHRRRTAVRLGSVRALLAQAADEPPTAH
jgi:hypothetical protein